MFHKCSCGVLAMTKIWLNNSKAVVAANKVMLCDVCPCGESEIWFVTSKLSVVYMVTGPADSLLYIDWGDGEIQVKTMTGSYIYIGKSYSSTEERIIRLSGPVTHLDCYANNITELNVDHASRLEHLDCTYNQLTFLDVSGAPLLNFLECRANNITELVLDDSPLLQWLYCDGLASLDVSGAPALEYLTVNDCSITSLDVTDNTVLKYLNCARNQLTTLDVSANKELVEVICYSNPLTTLNINGATSLNQLSVSYTQLTALDISGTPAILLLTCAGNNLSSSVVSEHLANLVTANNSNGSYDSRGQSPPAPLPPDGLIHKQALIARGWNIRTD